MLTHGVLVVGVTVELLESLQPQLKSLAANDLVPLSVVDAGLEELWQQFEFAPLLRKFRSFDRTRGSHHFIEFIWRIWVLLLGLGWRTFGSLPIV